MSTVPAPPAPSTLSDADYRRETDTLLARIEATTDRWLDEDVVDINTQPPLHEVWLAARAGGYHYKWVQGRWLDTRDGSEFLAALSRHASAQAGKALQFDAG